METPYNDGFCNINWKCKYLQFQASSVKGEKSQWVCLKFHVPLIMDSDNCSIRIYAECDGKS